MSPLVEIGLNDLPKTGGAKALPNPPAGDGPAMYSDLLYLGAGDAMVTPDFGRSVNPISNL